jgi:hypothetical protein
MIYKPKISSQIMYASPRGLPCRITTSPYVTDLPDDSTLISHPAEFDGHIIESLRACTLERDSIEPASSAIDKIAIVVVILWDHGRHRYLHHRDRHEFLNY